jgi:RNA 2',3'-cyclic 3'-phosphodiesterase
MSRPRGARTERSGGNSRRLFFALWPDSRLREQVMRTVGPIAALAPGRLRQPQQWHVTLVFLGAVRATRLPVAYEAAAAVRAEPFELTFDTVEHWRRAGVLCLAAQQTPPALERLVTALRGELGQRGFVTEQRAYRPHLTLARRVRPPPELPAPGPLPWPATEFVLVESTSGARGSTYTVLADWKLLG